METKTQLQLQPPERRHGILKRWNAQAFGFIYSRGEKFYCHISQIISGTPDIGCHCTFEIGVAPTPADLPPALRVEMGEMVKPRTVQS